MQRTTINGYAVAILVTMAAGACGYWLQPIYGERLPIAIFPLAVLAAAWAGGAGPGLVATIAGTATVAFFSFRPTAGQASPAATVVMLLLVALAGVLISICISRLRQQKTRACRAQAETDGRL